MAGLDLTDASQIQKVSDYAYLVPRTMWHIQSLGDSAYTGKWLMQLPNPSTFKKIQTHIDTTEDPNSSELGKAWAEIKKAAKEVVQFVQEVADITSGSKPISFRMVSVDFPFPTINTESVGIQSRNIDFPTGTQISSFSMTFLESKDFDVTNYFQNWLNCVISPATGNFGLPFDSAGYGYSQDLKLYVYDSMGINVGIGNLYGVFPTAISNISFDNKLDLLKVSVTCSLQASEWVKADNLILSLSAQAIGKAAQKFL